MTLRSINPWVSSLPDPDLVPQYRGTWKPVSYQVADVVHYNAGLYVAHANVTALEVPSVSTNWVSIVDSSNINSILFNAKKSIDDINDATTVARNTIKYINDRIDVYDRAGRIIPLGRMPTINDAPNSYLYGDSIYDWDGSTITNITKLLMGTSQFSNESIDSLSSKGRFAGKQLADGSFWEWSETGVADGGFVVNASGGGYWVRDKAGLTSISPRMFKATGDGSNESALIQNAVNKAHELNLPLVIDAFYTVGNIELPPITIIGTGSMSSGFKQLSNAKYIFHCDGENPASTVGYNLSNFCLIGRIVEDGFQSEHMHHLGFYGVTNVVIENILFKGMIGDGLHLGGTKDDATGIRHNKNITVRNCIFDGLINGNRNGISIIDGEDVTIEDNIFMNLTNQNMPGAIDIEPDTWHTQYVLRNISIRNNSFKNIGGMAGVIGFAYGANITELNNPNEQFQNIVIEGNVINNTTGKASYGLHFFSTTDATQTTMPNMNIVLRNNVVRMASSPTYTVSFRVAGVKGITFDNNTFSSTHSGIIGESQPASAKGIYPPCDIEFKNNNLTVSSHPWALTVEVVKNLTSLNDTITINNGDKLAGIVVNANGTINGVVINKMTTNAPAFSWLLGGGTNFVASGTNTIDRSNDGDKPVGNLPLVDVGIRPRPTITLTSTDNPTVQTLLADVQTLLNRINDTNLFK